MSFHARLLFTVVAAVLLAGASNVPGPRVLASGGEQHYPIVIDSSYSPDGQEVAFWADFRWRGPEIWAVSTVDGGLRPIAEGVNPAWSPMGSWIAFVSSRASESSIWLVRPDGSGLTQLTEGGPLPEPAWSPDGRQIAFVSTRDRTRSIWVINADGSGLRRLTNPPCCQNHPSFSPDGSQLVFEATAPTESHLMIMNADGTGVRQLTSGDVGRDSYPNWGPRGILFYSNRPGSAGIRLIRSDGTGLQVIPNVVGTGPVWAPDGNKFAFRSGFGIHEFNFLNNTPRPLVEIKGWFIPIDIMPGAFPKTIRLKETGRIRVAILPDARRSPLAGFDPVRQLGRTFLTFGRTGDERSLDS